MHPNAPNLNYCWAQLLMEELYRCGVRAVGVAPGSRSSPLAEAAAGHRRLRVVVHPDERGLAYHMLGVARGSGRPAAVVTTSGTAAANLLPAVTEAHHAEVPLIVITADRPHELRDCGANQATDQVKLYGAFVRRFFECPPPSAELAPGFLLAAVDDVVQAASGPPPGPAHINCLFREPLAPVHRSYPRRSIERALGRWPASDQPWVRWAAPARPVVPDLEEASACLAAASTGCVLVGAIPAGAASAVVELADALGWPLLPDLQSGLRLGPRPKPVIPHADLLLAHRAFRADCTAGCLLQFGSGFVTRRFLDVAADARIVQRILVDPSDRRVDPAHRSAIRLCGDPAAVAQALRATAPLRAEPSHLSRWRAASDRVERALGRRFLRTIGLSEPALAWTLSRLLREEDAWFVGNSLSIRMAATFASAEGRAVPLAASRGLSGIDGQLATASGYAAGAQRPVTVLLGDLTALHDLNSLALLTRASPVPVIVVVVNNDGGGIFSLLPIADSARHFERVFGTPHGLSFRAAAEMFRLAYAAPATMPAFVRAWRDAARHGTSALIEVRTRRRETARAVRGLQAAMVRLLDSRA